MKVNKSTWNKTCNLINKHVFKLYKSLTRLIQGIKLGSGGICCHNDRGHVRTGSLNPEVVKPRFWTYMPTCTVGTKPSRWGLITTMIWTFKFQPKNVSIPHLKWCSKREPFHNLLPLRHNVRRHGTPRSWCTTSHLWLIPAHHIWKMIDYL